MDDIEKLKKLLRHWKEHNDEHARTYRDWAEKASALGRQDLSEALERLHVETKKLGPLFENALNRI